MLKCGINNREISQNCFIGDNVLGWEDTTKNYYLKGDRKCQPH